MSARLAKIERLLERAVDAEAQDKPLAVRLFMSQATRIDGLTDEQFDAQEAERRAGERRIAAIQHGWVNAEAEYINAP